MNSSLDRAIAFYLDSSIIKKEIGFTFSDVIEFDNDTLEQCHGYIQWLFPIKEPSAYIEHAPLFTDETLKQYEEFYLIIWPRLMQAVDRMQAFYFYPNRREEWITPRNHNFLRLTRILKSLNLFRENTAEIRVWAGMRDTMNDPKYTDIIGSITAKFWKEAHEG